MDRKDKDMETTGKPPSGWIIALQISLFLIVLPVTLILLLEWVFGIL